MCLSHALLWLIQLYFIDLFTSAIVYFYTFSFVLAFRMEIIRIQNMMLENSMPSLSDSITQYLQQIT